MKKSNTCQSFARLFQANMNCAKVLCQVSVVVALALVLPNQAQAQNKLVNGTFQTGDYTGWNVYSGQGWNYAVANTSGLYGDIPGAVDPGVAYPLGATYSFWVEPDWNEGYSDYDGMYQDVAASAGDVFTADGWAYSYANDYYFNAGNGSSAYIEVMFRNVSGGTLALYESAGSGLCPVTTWPAGQWNDLQVIYQINPNTYTYMGTVSTLVAPTGTASVRYQIVWNDINWGGGSGFWDDFNLNFVSGPVAPTMSAISPSGITLCTNTHLTCTATASGSAVITNFQVSVTTSTLGSAPGTPVINNYNSSPAVTGIDTGTASLSIPLVPNTIYTAVTVSATDNNNLTGMVAARAFDTLAPVLVIEASDFNYNGGDFINTPENGGLALYYDQVGDQGTDENKKPGNGGPGDDSYYRTGDAVIIGNANPNTMIEQKFVTALANGDTTDVEVEVGYNSAGDWLDYTRTYGSSGYPTDSAPAGTYNVWLYMTTDGSGVQADLSRIAGDPTSSSQTTTYLGEFGTASFSYMDSSWAAYEYVPLTDQYGNLVPVTLTNGDQTLRSTVVGNPNLGFYMLVPAVIPQTPVLLSSYPDGTHPFEPTNYFTFTVGPGGGASIAGGISLVLNGVTVTPNLTASGNNYIGNYPIHTNSIYTAVITVVNATELSSTWTINFDTFDPNNYQLEFSDYDFSTNNGSVWISGLFIDNPVPTGDTTATPQTASPTLFVANSYYGYPMAFTPGADLIAGLGAIAQQGIDMSVVTGNGEEAYYRPDGVGDSPATDYVRPKFVASQTEFSDPNIGPFAIGWFDAGDWLNYTRHYPAGSYYVYGRMAGGYGSFSGTTLGILTTGYGTATQTTSLLGSFTEPAALGWGSYQWVPLLNGSGNMAVVSLGGQATLQLTSGGGLNAEFLMLVPGPLTLTPSIVAGQFNISFPAQTGYSYQVQYKGSLTAPTWTSVGSAITGDGAVHNVTESLSGTQGFYQVVATQQ
jgi:hypothetical protein